MSLIPQSRDQLVESVIKRRESLETVTQPAYQPSTDRAATVSNEVFWIPIDEHTPRGTKVLLINKQAGAATSGVYSGGTFFSHWHPLPRFRKDE